MSACVPTATVFTQRGSGGGHSAEQHLPREGAPLRVVAGPVGTEQTIEIVHRVLPLVCQHHRDEIMWLAEETE
jgi:hypothetical protein